MGTLNLYADRPVRVGDLCRYGEDPSPDWRRIGQVEEIGLRSTRLRGLDRTLTTIPNADFSNMHLVNLTKRDRMLLATTIRPRYETTRDQLR
jgi:MscS family membrane protein